VSDPDLAPLRALFPTLDFDRVRFHAGVPLRRGALAGLVLPTLGGTIHVFAAHEPGSLEHFATVAHELVHALQIQQGRARGYANAWIWSYLYCAVAAFTTVGWGANVYEREAYGFEGRLRKELQGADPNLACMHRLAFPRSEASLTDCRQRIGSVPVIGPLLAALWSPVAAILATAGWSAYTWLDLALGGARFVQRRFDKRRLAA